MTDIKNGFYLVTNGEFKELTQDDVFNLAFVQNHINKAVNRERLHYVRRFNLFTQLHGPALVVHNLAMNDVRNKYSVPPSALYILFSASVYMKKNKKKSFDRRELHELTNVSENSIPPMCKHLSDAGLIQRSYKYHYCFTWKASELIKDFNKYCRKYFEELDTVFKMQDIIE